MIRIIVENFLLFLLPTVLYLTYRYFVGRQSGSTSGGKNPSLNTHINDAPLLWLFAAGAGLVLATLIAFGSTDSGKPGQTYYPPDVKDGKIIPGHFK
jgi:uncharacterized protein DUF6111